MVPDNGVSDNIIEQPIRRANQVYRAFLNTTYEVEIYSLKHSRLSNRSKHMDFLIGIGAAASGGSGLGILADPQFVWVCAPLTTISTIGAIAKANYDWGGRLQTYLEIIKFLTPIQARYSHLTEDILARRVWNDDFEARFDKLRTDLANMPIDATKDLPVNKRRAVQDSIKQRLNYKSWWGWQDTLP